ncbi:DUF6268 family outer membrane beta-barrel protein [Akkermansiaceae bacterium]|nr:DUF6268 family outer membrane beta-barrel protein [Akkermansiaceae bacterium]
MNKASFFTLALISKGFIFAQASDPVSLGFLSKFNSDLDSSNSVSVNHASLKTGLPLKKTDSVFVALSATYVTEEYDFDGDFQPWDDFQQLSIGIPVFIDFSDDWKWSSIYSVASSKEQGADFNDSLSYGVVTSLNYRYSDTLTIGPGFGLYSQIEDSASIYPIISLNWQITPDWKLATGPSEGASSGANLYLQYSALDRWNFTAGAYYQSNRFRLSSSSDASTNGVGETEVTAAYAVAKYRAHDSFSVSLIAGLSVGDSYELSNSSGRKLREESTDAATFVGVRVNYNF